MNKAYLGDGVYIECDGLGQVVLTTNDGINTTNIIYLEPEVVQAMIKWVSDNFISGPLTKEMG